MDKKIIVLFIVALLAVAGAVISFTFGSSDEVDFGEPPPEVIEHFQRTMGGQGTPPQQ